MSTAPSPRSRQLTFASTTRPCGTRGAGGRAPARASRPVRLTSPRTAPCSCPSAAAGGPRGCGCTACSCTRRRPWCARWRAAAAAHQPQRGRGRAPLHERELHRVRRVPRTLPPLGPAGRSTICSTSTSAQHPLLRLRPARAFDLGPGSRARAARGLTFAATIPCWPSSASTPCSNAEVPPYFLESVVSTRWLAPPPGRSARRGGPHRLPLPRSARPERYGRGSARLGEELPRSAAAQQRRRPAAHRAVSAGCPPRAGLST